MKYNIGCVNLKDISYNINDKKNNILHNLIVLFYDII